MTQDSEVLGGVTRPDAALVLAKGDVEDPMEAIFDTPVVTNGAGEGVGLPVEAAEVLAKLRLKPPSTRVEALSSGC